MSDDLTSPVAHDPWHTLRPHTPARIGLGRVGVSQPTQALLAFNAAHAQARDAVHLPLDVDGLCQRLPSPDGGPVLRVRSAAPDRATYLLRPDLGRRLDAASRHALTATEAAGCDVLWVVADGLSAAAIERQAGPFMERVLARCPPGWRLGPLVIATQARVALGDEIGQHLRARAVAMLIGERPGLSSPDSLGVYLTHDPRIGRTDAQRNCLSNIRPEGLRHDDAARKLWWLLARARQLGATGVALKDLSDEQPLITEGPG